MLYEVLEKEIEEEKNKKKKKRELKFPEGKKKEEIKKIAKMRIRFKHFCKWAEFEKVSVFKRYLTILYKRPCPLTGLSVLRPSVSGFISGFIGQSMTSKFEITKTSISFSVLPLRNNQPFIWPA